MTESKYTRHPELLKQNYLAAKSGIMYNVNYRKKHKNTDERDSVMSPEEEAFLSTKQEKIKLYIALSAFFETEDTEWKERCRTYLKKRFRPAMSELIRRGDVLHIRALAAEGWLTEETLDSFIHEAVQTGRPEVCALLLNLKRELFGFHDREFTL